MGQVLRAAAVYNVLWGALVVLFPLVPFAWAGMEPPNYPELWQCIGMIVGVYGVGYWIAAGDVVRHWPIVLVGLLGKVFGPIGFLWSAWSGRLPWMAGWTILTNDLIWWLPFVGILGWVYAVHNSPPTKRRYGSLAEALKGTTTTTGQTLAEISDERPMLIVFLRHAGCTFCREAAFELAATREEIERRGTQIVLVHMTSIARGREFFTQYGLADLPQVSDPGRALYQAFDLHRGTFWQLLGPTVWWRGFKAGMLQGHGVGKLEGDGTQMPGTFLVYRGKIVKAFRHKTAADRPDYEAMAVCEISA